MFRLTGFPRLLFSLWFVCAAPCAFPQTGAGSLDPDYAPMLTAEGGFTLAAQAAGGKLVVAGKFDFIKGVPRRSIARLGADGSVDLFAAPAPSDPNLFPLSIAALDDGRVAACYGNPNVLTIGGSVGEGSLLRVFAADGALESEIVAEAATTGNSTMRTYAARVAASGNVIYFAKATTVFYNVGPPFITPSQSNTVESIGLAGTVVEKPVFGAIGGLLPLADGKVLVWGNFAQVNSSPRTGGVPGERPGLARLNADLSLDAWMPSGLPAAPVLGAVAGPGGTTYVATNRGWAVHLLRLLADGSLDSSFGQAFLLSGGAAYSNSFQRLLVATDGSVVVVFATPTYISGPVESGFGYRFMRFDPAGVLNREWTRAASASGARDLFFVSGDGRALVAEPTSLADGVPLANLRWLNADGAAGGVLANAVRRGATGAVAVRSDGTLLVAPSLLASTDSTPFTAINGKAHSGKAWLREDGVLDWSFNFVTGPDTGGVSVLSPPAFRFDEADRLVVSGAFTQFNGLPCNGLARLRADRSIDVDFLPELPPGFSITAFAFRTDGRLAVGTNAFAIGPIVRLRGFLEDGRADAALPDLNAITALAPQPDGALLFLGKIASTATAAPPKLQRITAQNQLDAAYAPQIVGEVSRVFALPSGSAMILGNFTSVEGNARPGFARLKTPGILDPSFDPGTGPNGPILDLAAQADGKIIIAGNFTSYDGTPCGRVIRLNAVGTIDTTFHQPNVDGRVTQVAVLADGRVQLIGDFISVDGAPRTGLARLLPGAGPLPPMRPAALRVVQISPTEARLVWDDVRRETGYCIERRFVGINLWVPLGSVAADVTTFFASGVTPGAEYRVIALSASGNSAPSPVIVPAVPGVPRGLSAVGISPQAIRLAWTDVGGETGYRIERSDFAQTAWTLVATLGENVTSFTESGLPAAQTFSYRVSAFNFAGSSAPGTAARAMTWYALFPNAAGKWSGIVIPAVAQNARLRNVLDLPDSKFGRSGALDLDIARSGAFTGVLHLGPKRLGLRGVISADGVASVALAGMPGVADQITFALDASGTAGSGRLLRGDDDRARFNLVRAQTWTTEAPSPFTGTHTLLLPRDPAATTAPDGTGFATIAVSAEGTVRLAGMLADGTVFSQGAQLSADGRWPFFLRLYEGAGSVTGWLQFGENERLGSPEGLVRWSKPALPHATLHREVLYTTLIPAGARYRPIMPVWSINRRMRIALSGGDLAFLPQEATAFLNQRNKVTTLPSSTFTMEISTPTGLFSGTFLAPNEREPRRFRGALFQPERRGAGSFRGAAESGAVTFYQTPLVPVVVGGSGPVVFPLE